MKNYEKAKGILSKIVEIENEEVLIGFVRPINFEHKNRLLDEMDEEQFILSYNSTKILEKAKENLTLQKFSIKNRIT